MARRNLWNAPSAPAGNVPATWEGQLPAAVVATPPTASPAMDLLRVAPMRTRKREWEKQQQAGAATYRGITPELQAELRTTAGILCVPLDELASVLLQHGLEAYRAGELILTPIFQARHLTLFPNGWQPQPASSTTLLPKNRAGRWRHVVSYRHIAPEVQTGIRIAAQELQVPVGEVAAACLQHSLTAYRAGTFKLNPQPRTTRLTLE